MTSSQKQPLKRQNLWQDDKQNVQVHFTLWPVSEYADISVLWVLWKIHPLHCLDTSKPQSWTQWAFVKEEEDMNDFNLDSVFSLRRFIWEAGGAMMEDKSEKGWAKLTQLMRRSPIVSKWTYY